MPPPHPSLQVPLGDSNVGHSLCAKHFARHRGDGGDHSPRRACSAVGTTKLSSEHRVVTAVCSGC